MAPQVRRRNFGQQDSGTSRSPKRARGNAINNSADRLSDLPDALLCHILSFIDTKYAVATSVLSKRWKHLYLSVPNIILDDSLTRITNDEESSRVFATFGLKQIRLRTVPHINLFRLKCNFDFDYYNLIKTMVSAAIFYNVKELDICICMEDGGNVSLPPEVFTSGSLVVLKVKGYDETSKLRGDDEPSVELAVPDLVSLPKLKVLHLGTVVLYDSINRLFQGCKLLEDLCLSGCIYPDVVLDFSFPFLRKLSIKNCDNGDYYSIECTELVIDAPNLELFEFRAKNAAYLLRMKKPMSNGTAKFDFWEMRFDNLLQFIVELRGLKSLYLSEIVDRPLKGECNCHQLSSLKASAFETLTRLELQSSTLEILPNILEYAPELEVLVINKHYESEKTTIGCPHLPETVPICLTEHLRNIEFRLLVSSEPELEHDMRTMKYFLENGKVLQKMKISITDWWYDDSDPDSICRSVREKLEMFFSGFSKSCEDSGTARPPKSARRDTINETADRLSDLPDPLLCHILSFVDTKYAVATSILSKRWKHLYVYVPNIILDDSLTRNTKNEQSFMVFAMFGLKQIMLRTVPHIHLFRLKCNFIVKYHLIKTLICASIFHNVKELDICICMEDGGNITSPPEVFTSGSLVVLKLTGDRRRVPSLVLVVPDLVCLPKLKVLHLGTHVLDESINRLFKGCKLLEDLCLSRCILVDCILDFSFPFLRKLSIKECACAFYNIDIDCGELVIDAPKLALFEYHADDEMTSYLRMKKPMSNGTAKFDFLETKFENLLQFVIALRGIKSLSLSHVAVKGDCQSNRRQLSSFKAPAVKTLTMLELRASALDILPNILEFAEKLEVLVIDKAYEFGVTEFTCPDLPETVPICLTEHLRNVEFVFCITSEPQLEHDIETMKYFLQYGKVLERMEIFIMDWWCDDYERDSNRSPSSIYRSVCKKLEMLQGFSNTCEVVIENLA